MLGRDLIASRSRRVRSPPIRQTAGKESIGSVRRAHARTHTPLTEGTGRRDDAADGGVDPDDGGGGLR